MHYIYQLSAILTVRPFFFFWKKCFYLSICFPCLCVGVCKERKISSETWPEIKGAVSVKHYNFSEALMIWGLQTRLQSEVAILSFPSWALSRIKMNRGNFSYHNYNFRGLWLTLNKLVSHFQSIPQEPQWGFFWWTRVRFGCTPPSPRAKNLARVPVKLRKQHLCLASSSCTRLYSSFHCPHHLCCCALLNFPVIVLILPHPSPPCSCWPVKELRVWRPWVSCVYCQKFTVMHGILANMCFHCTR